MKIVGNLAGISTLCILFLLSSCGGNDNSGEVDDCGATGPKVHLITGYETSLMRYDKRIEINNNPPPKPLANNEFPEWNAFSIELKATYQNYQAKVLSLPHFSLFAQAEACSPVLPAGKQKLTKISITSADDFSPAYPAGSELLSLFGAIDYNLADLGVLLVNRPAPLALKLMLLQAPLNALQNFEIQIALDDGSVYILQTGDVYFNLPYMAN